MNGPIAHGIRFVLPETGRKSLFVNPGFTSHIDGLDANESKAILEFLYHHSIQPQFLYRHRWTEKIC